MNITEQNFLNILDSVKFGIEFECCYHILNHPLFVKEKFDEESEMKARKELLSCFRYKNSEVKWTIIDKHDDVEYDEWMLVDDNSIKCSRKGFCMLDNLYYSADQCSKLFFYPVEIVTPILEGREGIKTLLTIWLGVIMGSDIVYSVNESQGLHVNISHNLMTEKFARLWAYWEPVILQTIPQERRNNKFALPVFEKITSEIKDVNELLLEKYQSLHYHPGSRYEVRIHQGTMDIDEILNWLALIMIILSESLTLQDFPSGNYVNSFFEMLKDKNLINYFMAKYYLYKDSSWPNPEITETKTQIFNLTFDSLSLDSQKIILESRNKKCMYDFVDRQKYKIKLFETKDTKTLKKLIKNKQIVWEDVENFLKILEKNQEYFDYLQFFYKNFRRNKYDILNYMLEYVSDNENLMLEMADDDILQMDAYIQHAIKNNHTKVLELIAENHVEDLLKQIIRRDESVLFSEILEKYGNNIKNYESMITFPKNSYYIEKLLQYAKENFITLDKDEIINFFTSTFLTFKEFQNIFGLLYEYYPELFDCEDIKKIRESNGLEVGIFLKEYVKKCQE